MPQAIVNPEELERFATNLKQFSNNFKELITQMNGQFSQLGGSWRDQEHRKFAGEYQQTMKVLQRFIEITDKHIPFLFRKAQKVREYLQQK